MPPATHRNALEPGARLHWYAVERVLGQGGFGITYLARDTNLAQPVALKEFLPMELAVRDPDGTVHPNSADHEEVYAWGLERFVTEGQTLARFDHPSIVRVLAVFEANGTAYLVMRYEQGDTLADRLRGRGTLEEPRLLGMLLPLLDGLEIVHAQGFIHRDIKPANIFLRADESPVLIDFGSARQALGQETRTLTALVSPGYAPFEQYSNRADEQGPWTDIYALAATAYRAVTGRSPPDAIDRSHRLHAGEEDPLAAAAKVARGRYSPGVLESIDRGLAFRRQDRPQTVTLWRHRFVDEGSSVDREAPTQVAGGVAAPGDDATTRIDTAGVITAGPSSETATEVAGAAPVEVIPPATPPSAPRRGRRLAAGAVAALAVLGGAATFVALRSGDRGTPDAPAPMTMPAVPVRPPAAATRSTEAQSVAPAASDRRRDAPRQSDAPPDVDSLLASGRRQLRDGQRIWPAGDNAYETYREILLRDPSNEDARAGLGEVFEAESKGIQAAIKAHDYDRAERSLDRMIELSPNADRLKKMRERVRKARAKGK